MHCCHFATSGFPTEIPRTQNRNYPNTKGYILFNMKRHLVKILITLFFGYIVLGCQENQQESEWMKLPSPVSAQIRCFAESSDGTYYAGTSELYRSNDKGITWELMDFEGVPFEVMETQDGSLLVGTYRGGIFRSIDKGDTWTNVGF